jgi:hypothetical protein
VQPYSLLAPFAPRFSQQLASVFFVHQHYMGTMPHKSILNRRVYIIMEITISRRKGRRLYP